jgi:class 3 adenylate cyclase
MDAMTIATFTNDWYREAASTIRGAGGRVVKFMGDACLATFPDACAVEAVDAALSLRRGAAALGERLGLSLDLGVNVHLAIVAAGELGPDDDLRYDVLGNEVNHLFTMGHGPGVRISEPVYRALPNKRRGSWEEHRPPATYSHEGR